ncbi:cytochrome P450 [Colletotrichum higginsianum]|nr:cytochrome P450 [Colletotrichum higginsianum]
MTYLLLRLVEYLVLKPAPEEPPLVRSPVPFLGHIFGLLGYGVSYYAYLRGGLVVVYGEFCHSCSDWNIRATTNLPILTLYLASQKTYIVNSPELISVISRRQKEIDGNIPFITIVYGKLFGFQHHDVSELLRNSMDKGSLRQAAHVIEHTLLAPNTAASKEVYTKIFNGLADHINKIGEGQQSIAIQQWLQQAFTLSTANALHGPNGPFAQSPDLVDTFWYDPSDSRSTRQLCLPC